ncbi:M6 family metalloprotease domain-containing protein [Cohnella fermenti]|nr:M6 family metalloprotease domain-containing protein [Cohnella fermenti]
MKKSYRLWLASALLLLAVIALGARGADAAPARTDLQTFTQPGGQSFQGRLQGDENLHWALTSEDEVIVRDAQGYWNYASLELKDHSFKSSGVRVKLHPKPAEAKSKQDLDNWLKQRERLQKNGSDGDAGSAAALSGASGSPSLSEQAESRVSASLEAAADTAGAGLFFGLDGLETTGTQNVLLLLVEFSDIDIQYSDSQWNGRFFSATGKSVSDYYREVSQNRMSLVPAAETAGTANDGIVKVRLNHAYASGAATVAEALTAADPYIDLSAYDANGDGYLQNDELKVVTILAGYEQAYGATSSQSVWAHFTSLSDAMSPLIDGTKACVGAHGAGYTQQGEIQGNHQATIGVLAHELGHMFGLPDLYDTDGSSSGIGNHSLMGGGNWASLSGEYAGATPVHLDAWSKLMLGFADATIAQSDASASYTLNSIATGSYSIVLIPTLDANQYFLLENRQYEGYDRGLGYPGGIAIWHIDQSRSSNADDDRRLVDLEEANAISPYYYSGNATSFAPLTSPNSDRYDGSSFRYTGITVNIPQASSSSMTAAIYGDYTPLEPATGLWAPYTARNSVGLSWTASDSPELDRYQVYRNGTLVSSLTKNTLKDWVTEDATYSYTVRTVDRAGNVSADSEPLSVTSAETNKIVLYYKTNNATPYVRYTISPYGTTEVWQDLALAPSEIPGYSKAIIDTGADRINGKGAFHDGNGTWDNNSGYNYTLYSGVTTIANGVITEDFPAAIPNPAGNNAIIYYKNGSFAASYIHYKLDGSSSWTTVPGTAMSSSAYAGYSVATIPLGAATGLTAAFNNGSGSWDNNGGSDYRFGSGTSTLANGNLYAGTPQADSVTFQIAAPGSTPSGADLYLAGTFNGWDPGDSAYRLTRGSDGIYRITVALAAGTAYEFKFTRGAWSSVEAASSGADIANRTLTPGSGPQTVNLTVERWKDL